MATPHAGTEVAKIISCIAGVPLRGLLGKVLRPDLINDLRVKSEKLDDIGKQFVQRVRDLHVVTFWETQRWSGPGWSDVVCIDLLSQSLPRFLQSRFA